MNPMIIVVILFAMLLVASCAVACSKVPRVVGGVYCFLAMLVVCVAFVLVFVVKGF